MGTGPTDLDTDQAFQEMDGSGKGYTCCSAHLARLGMRRRLAARQAHTLPAGKISVSTSRTASCAPFEFPRMPSTGLHLLKALSPARFLRLLTPFNWGRMRTGSSTLSARSLANRCSTPPRSPEAVLGAAVSMSSHSEHHPLIGYTQIWDASLTRFLSPHLASACSFSFCLLPFSIL